MWAIPKPHLQFSRRKTSILPQVSSGRHGQRGQSQMFVWKGRTYFWFSRRQSVSLCRMQALGYGECGEPEMSVREPASTLWIARSHSVSLQEMQKARDGESCTAKEMLLRSSDTELCFVGWKAIALHTMQIRCYAGRGQQAVRVRQSSGKLWVGGPAEIALRAVQITRNDQPQQEMRLWKDAVVCHGGSEAQPLRRLQASWNGVHPG